MPNPVTAPAVDAFADDALGDLDTVGLLAAMASGERHPDELRDAALARANATDGQLNAVVDWIPEPSHTTGPLAGIPTFLKDNEDLLGHPTRFGSAATPDRKSVV